MKPNQSPQSRRSYRVRNPNIEYRNPKQIRISEMQMTEPQTNLFEYLGFEHLNIRILDLFRASNFVLRIYDYYPRISVSPRHRVATSAC